MRGETEYKIRCAGSNKLYGKFVPMGYCCKYWSRSFDEFVRVKKQIPYEDYYKEKLDYINSLN